jgi:hypothetical protein
MKCTPRSIASQGFLNRSCTNNTTPWGPSTAFFANHRNQCRRLLKLINNVLDLSRNKAGKPDYFPQVDFVNTL